MSTETKESHWKGQSRVLKLCHWCTKKQQSGAKAFQACSRCKEVIYCSKECQVASWPLHKVNCKQSAEAKVRAAENPGMAQAIANFKKWHGSHLDELRHAAICALDLGNTPSRLDDHIIFIEVKLKFNHAELPQNKKYEPVNGFTMSTEETEELLGLSGVEILENAKAANLHMRSKGSVGVATLIMKAHDIIDVVKIALSSPEAVRVEQLTASWGDKWMEKLKLAVEID